MRSSPDGYLKRLLLYSHDTYGLGHLRRNLGIANHMLATVPGLQVVLITGSTAARRFPLPRGLSLAELPPVVKVAAEEYRAREPGLDFAAVRHARATIIADVARHFSPDVFLVDHAPQGMKGELLPAFDALARYRPATRVVLGLRDVIDDPAVVRQTWEQQRVAETLERVYDRVVIYGCRDILDVADAYRFPVPVLARTTYSGYLCRRPVGAPATTERPDLPEGPFVLGTAGGGGDGLAMLNATLEAADDLGVASVLVTGPLMDRQERVTLEQQARVRGLGRVVEFVPGLEHLIAAASAVVTMGGYNALSEIIPSGVPAIVVPRVWPRREQAIRGELFAARGLVRVVEPGPALGARLAEVLRDVLHGEARPAVPFDGNGLERLREVLLEEAMRAYRARVSGSAERPDSRPELAKAVPA